MAGCVLTALEGLAVVGPGEPIPARVGAVPSIGQRRDLVLHLSAPLQHAVERRLTDALAKYGASSGSIIIMDPHTGGILALANWPSFDPNVYDQAEPHTWQNPAVGLLYEPGSVFKLITYGAALDLGAIVPDQQFEDKGERKVGDKTITNSRSAGWGWVTGWKALAESLNTVSADIGLKNGLREFLSLRPLVWFRQAHRDRPEPGSCGYREALGH